MDNLFDPTSVPRTEDARVSRQLVDSSRKIKWAQTIGLIAGVFAATLLLILLILQIIPYISIAFSIVVGALFCVSLIVSMSSFCVYLIKMRKVLVELAEASTALRASFINCTSDLTRNLELYRSSGRKKSVQTQTEDLPPLSPQPLIPAPEEEVEVIEIEGEILPETPLELPEEEVSVPQEKVEFVDNQLDGLMETYLLDTLQHSIEQHYKYNHKQAAKVMKCFSSCCTGLATIVDRRNRGEAPLSKTELVTMFMPCFRVDSHTALRVTCNARDLFAVENSGVLWLNSILKHPEEGNSLLYFIETIKQSKILSPSLPTFMQFVNLFLSGWCLGDPDLYANIVGSVQALPLDESIKMQGIALLASGNVLSALHVLLSPTHSGWAKVFEGIDKDERLTEEDIDLSCFRDFFSANEEDVSDEQETKALSEFISVFLSELGNVLPNNVLSLGIDVISSGSILRLKLKEFFNILSYSTMSNFNLAFLLIECIKKATQVQMRCKSYLPAGGKEMLYGLLSNTILGGYISGIFTKKHYAKLEEIFNLGEEGGLQKAICSRKISSLCLPEFFS